MLETGRQCLGCERRRYLKDFRGDLPVCRQCEIEERIRDEDNQNALSLKLSSGDKSISLCECLRFFLNRKVGRLGSIRNYSECELCRNQKIEFGMQEHLGLLKV